MARSVWTGGDLSGQAWTAVSARKLSFSDASTTVCVDGEAPSEIV